MDESGFGALILLIPKKCDLVRKTHPIHRHNFLASHPYSHKAPSHFLNRMRFELSARIPLTALAQIQSYLPKNFVITCLIDDITCELFLISFMLRDLLRDFER
jgi:hypothetical protein